MNTFLQTATESVHEGVDQQYLLPAGFPFLIDEDTGKIIEPVLFFLTDTYIQAGHWVKNSVLAAASDLKDWYSYLSYYKKSWSNVNKQDLERYRDSMFATISPTTHKPYSIKTIRRRMTSITSFYDWAFRDGYIEEEIDSKSARRVNQSIDKDMLAHLGKNLKRATSNLIPRLRSGSDDHIQPFTPAEYRNVAKELGPLPSDKQHDSRPSRDRLASELALNSGLRVDEVANLTVWHILNLTPDENTPLGICPMTLTHTKGSKPRKVLVPNWLVIEIIIYIEGERRSALDEGKRRYIKGKGQETKSLFVNHASSTHNAGRPIKSKSLQEAFHRAIINSGLTIMEKRIDPDTNVSYMACRAAHSFHDLRHSYAVWTYHARVHAGDSQPWKFIQSVLGHSSLSLTMDTYLRVVDVFESVISDRMMKYFKQQAES